VAFASILADNPHLKKRRRAPTEFALAIIVLVQYRHKSFGQPIRVRRNGRGEGVLVLLVFEMSGAPTVPIISSDASLAAEKLGALIMAMICEGTILNMRHLVRVRWFR